MDWIEFESLRLRCPTSADVLARRETVQGFQTAAEVIGDDEGGEVRFELQMVVKVITFDGGILIGPVHPLNLSIRPGMFGFGQPVLDAILPATHVGNVRQMRKSGLQGMKTIIERKPLPRSIGQSTSGLSARFARRRPTSASSTSQPSID